jgi:hypothetical protein
MKSKVQLLTNDDDKLGGDDSKTIGKQSDLLAHYPGGCSDQQKKQFLSAKMELWDTRLIFTCIYPLHANKKRLIYFFQVSSWVTLILCTAEARG